MTHDRRSRHTFWRAARVTLMWLGAMLLLYAVFVRPSLSWWGATETEVGRRMPGDGIVGSPDLDATRAIAIAATADQVWPLLVQRAGQIVARRMERTGGMSVKEAVPGRWIVWWDGRGDYS